jgi:hypothetical protein
MQALRSRYSGNEVLPILAVLLVAALGALVAIAVSRGDDGTRTLVATDLPARTVVPKVPIFGTQTLVPTPPVVTTTLLPATNATTLTDWTVADGYTLVLASIPAANGRASAVQIAKHALAQGLLDVGVIDTSAFSGLAPGFFVVFSGVYDSTAAAAAQIRQAEAAGFAAPYARRVTR